MATQGQRREQTRTALMNAAARLFAERGVAESSVDAIAELAGRTSGALYDHFGNKEGVLFALLERWVDDVAVVVSAELITADSLEQRMAALWRNISEPTVGDGTWIALEHEMWSYAARHDSARQHLANRYRAAWAGIDVEWADPIDGTSIGPVVIGLLLGLEMMRRVDPDALTDDMAIAALCRVVTSAHSARTTSEDLTGVPE